MARIRTVKPELFASPTLARVSIEARFLFVGMLTEADDEGRLIDSPKRLAGALFPHDDVTANQVATWLEELQSVAAILRYSSGEGRYIAIPAWEKHQRISHKSPSKIPKPSGEPVDQGIRPPENFGEAPESLGKLSRSEVEVGSGSGSGSGGGVPRGTPAARLSALLAPPPRTEITTTHHSRS